MGWTDGHMAALDFETTSTDPLTARIVTASLVVVRPGHRHVIKMEWLVAVDEPIPEEATAKHKVTTEHARQHGRLLGEVLPELGGALEMVWKPDVPLVAFNAPYDLTVLAAELRRCGTTMAPPDPHTWPVVDPLVCDRGLDRYRRGSRKLADVCGHYGVQLDDAHNSTADALAAARVAWKMARRWPELADMPLPMLHHQQERWHAEWAANYQDYLRTKADPLQPDAVIDGSWPVQALDVP